jgi:hypothetical protein
MEASRMKKSTELGELEFFAAAAMSGILSNPRPRKHGILAGKDMSPSAVAEGALACAKAMLFALDADLPGKAGSAEGLLTETVG